MERFDIEQPPWARRANSNPSKFTTTDSNTVSNQWRDVSHFISLRKYSPAICLIEALAIVFLVYLLIRLPQADGPVLPTGNVLNYYGNVSNSNHPYRTYYSSNLGLNVTVLPSLVQNCNQRRHDLSLGVQCKSSSMEHCNTSQVQPISGVERGQNEDDESSHAEFTAAVQPISVIETSRSGRRLKTHQLRPELVYCRPTIKTSEESQLITDSRCRFSTRIEIDPQRMHQKIIGWGGALSDSTINNILALTVNGTRALLEDYFGLDGLAFNMVRVTIGGSDFSARFYTNDDGEQPKDPEAHRLKQFELTEEDLLYKIPLLKLVQDRYNSIRKLKFFASMWSPPLWMKTNGHFNKGQLRGSISDEPLVKQSNKDAERFHEALADLKLRWLLSYKQHEIDFWGLTVMNEPIFAVQPFIDFNTMIFPHEDYANYIVKYLGPKLRQNEQTKQIKLMVHDDNRRFLMNFTKPVLDQRRVRQYVDGVSVHGYIDQEYDQMDYMYEMYRDIDKPAKKSSSTQTKPADADWFVLPTELCSGHLPFMEKALVGNWHRGMHYALDIINSLQHSAAGWVDWNMVLDTEGGPGWLGGRLDAPIIVDKGRDLYYKSPMYYVLGQFSRYIPPESQRLQTKLFNGLYDSQFEVVTFQVADHEFATVVVNNNPYPVKFLLHNPKERPNADGLEPFFALESRADSVMTFLHH